MPSFSSIELNHVANVICLSVGYIVTDTARMALNLSGLVQVRTLGLLQSKVQIQA